MTVQVTEQTSVVRVVAGGTVTVSPPPVATVTVLEQPVGQPAAVQPTDVQVTGQGARGPQGPAGEDGAPGSGGGTTVRTAGGTILAFHAVWIDDQGFAEQASSSITAQGNRVLGVALTAALAGEQITVATDQLVDTTPVTWPAGPLYVAPDGSLTPTPPTAGYQLQIADATAASLLIIRPQFPIYL